MRSAWRGSKIGLLLVGAAVLSACDEQEEKKDVSARPVAKLAKTVGEVSHRSANTVVWKPAKQDMKLYDRDALKTGEGASAVVSFLLVGKKLRLEIEEQSLVIIEAPSQAPPQTKPKAAPTSPPRVARVERGTIRGIAEPGAPPVRVATPQGETEISAAGKEPVPFRVRMRKGGKVEVAVLKGTAQVRSGTSEVTVEPRHVVDIERKGVSKPVELLPYPVLIAPPVDAEVVAGSDMELRWTPVGGAALYRVQVSRAVSFEERLFDTTVVTPFFKLPAPKAMQTYVWRVASVDPAGRESEFGYARRFHVKSAEVAALGQLLHPPDNTGLQLIIGKPSPVLFRWKGEGEMFELVVARSPTLRKGVVSRRRMKETEEVLTSLHKGVYYWGVYALGEGGKDRRALFEKAYKLVISRRKPPYVRVPKAIKWK